MERRYATKEDFIKNIDILTMVWNEYKELYNKEMIKRNGMISVKTINDLIKKAKKTVGTKEEHEVSVEGFFDGYVAIFTEVCHSGVVHRSIDMQISKLKEESLLSLV